MTLLLEGMVIPHAGAIETWGDVPGRRSPAAWKAAPRLTHDSWITVSLRAIEIWRLLFARSSTDYGSLAPAAQPAGILRPARPPARSSTRMRSQRITRWLIAWRWPLLVLGAIAVAAAWLPAQNLGFDRSIENMFAPDDPLLPPFRQLKRTFGGDEIALAAYVDRELLSTEGLDRLEELTKDLAGVPGVASAFSLASVKPLLTSALLASLRERVLELSEGYTVGADRQTAGIVCILSPEHETKTPRAQTVDELRRRIERHDPTGVLTGEPVMVVDGFRYLEDDGRLLGLVSTALLMATIVVCFRSLRWVLVPMAVVGAALVWTKATLAGSGLHLSMVSSMLWAIVTVIGVATVVHLVIGFRDARKAGLPAREALEAASAMLATPIFWACATDAAGFASLMASSVGPVHDFGVMMLIGSLLTLAAIAVVAPGLSLAGRFDADPQRAWGERGLELGLSRVVDLIERHPRGLALAVGLVCGGCSWGMIWTKVETDFTNNFRQSSPIVRSYDFIENRLGGAGVWDVFLPVPEQPDAEFIERVAHLEDRLRREAVVRGPDGSEQPGLTKTLSAIDALDLIPYGKAAAARNLEQTLTLLGKQMPIVAALHGRDPNEHDRYYLRIMLRARERQSSQQKHELIEQVRRISREEFPEAQTTGFFVLLTKLIESITRDQWLTFGIASAAIGLLMLAAFRSLRLAIVALVPNAAPIFVVSGLMGWFGFKINMGAAMIASVSMGLAIDSSIHYITAFRRQRSAGRSVHEALHAVHQTVGRAMVFSTLALIVGFSVLALSRFVPTIYFGVLVGLTMFGGLLGNLVLLPLLLKLIDRER